MNLIRTDIERLQNLVGDAFTKTGALVALTDAGVSEPDKLQRTLEFTADQFERATLELRGICERSSPGIGGYAKRPQLRPMQIAGSIELLEYEWVHIRLNTLLPHCRYQPPAWLSDTIQRLLDEYTASGLQLPYFHNQAALVIEEYSAIGGRTIYDQDNKGWKAVSNALKGRLFADDNQYDLGLVLLSKWSSENVTHITVLDLEDLPRFLTSYALGPIRWNADYDG